MKDVVTNKVLKSKPSSKSLKRDSSGNMSTQPRRLSRDNSKLVSGSDQKDESPALIKESSTLSLMSVKSNLEQYSSSFNRGDNNLQSQRATQSLTETTTVDETSPTTPSKNLQIPQSVDEDRFAEFTDLASIADEQSKNSSLDSGTGSFTPVETRAGSTSGSQKALPNNHVQKTSGETQSGKVTKEKSVTKKAHKPIQVKNSSGAASVNAIELTPVDATPESVV